MEHNGAFRDVKISVAESAPGLLTATATGKGQAAALNEDLTIDSASNPAPSVLWGCCMGRAQAKTNPSGADGEVAGQLLPKPVLPISVTIGGNAASVVDAGAVSVAVAGLNSSERAVAGWHPFGRSTCGFTRWHCREPAGYHAGVQWQAQRRLSDRPAVTVKPKRIVDVRFFRPAAARPKILDIR